MIPSFKAEAEHEGLQIVDALPESTFWPFCRVSTGGQELIITSPPIVEGIPIPFNFNLARFVLAKLVGREEIADWRRCILDQPVECKMVEDLRKSLSFE